MADGGADDALSFYALLNVSREATDDDIKRAFRWVYKVQTLARSMCCNRAGHR